MKPVCGKNSSLIKRGLVKRNIGFELPALSLVPLALLPPKDCWPMRAAVVLQSASCVLLANELDFEKRDMADDSTYSDTGFRPSTSGYPPPP